MTESRGRGRRQRGNAGGRGRRNKHSNVRQMMVRSSSPAQFSSQASASASDAPSDMLLSSQSRTTAQRFTQLRNTGQPGTQSRTSEVHVPYVRRADTLVQRTALTEKVADTDSVFDNTYDMEIDGTLAASYGSFAAGDDAEGEMSGSDSENELDPEMQGEKDRLADVRLPSHCPV
jgi:hypothetical protein